MADGGLSDLELSSRSSEGGEERVFDEETAAIDDQVPPSQTPNDSQITTTVKKKERPPPKPICSEEEAKNLRLKILGFFKERHLDYELRSCLRLVVPNMPLEKNNDLSYVFPLKPKKDSHVLTHANFEVFKVVREWAFSACVKLPKKELVAMRRFKFNKKLKTVVDQTVFVCKKMPIGTTPMCGLFVHCLRKPRTKFDMLVHELFLTLKSSSKDELSPDAVCSKLGLNSETFNKTRMKLLGLRTLEVTISELKMRNPKAAEDPKCTENLTSIAESLLTKKNGYSHALNFNFKTTRIPPSQIPNVDVADLLLRYFLWRDYVDPDYGFAVVKELRALANRAYRENNSSSSSVGSERRLAQFFHKELSKRRCTIANLFTKGLRYVTSQELKDIAEALRDEHGAYKRFVERHSDLLEIRVLEFSNPTHKQQNSIVCPKGFEMPTAKASAERMKYLRIHGMDEDMNDSPPVVESCSNAVEIVAKLAYEAYKMFGPSGVSVVRAKRLEELEESLSAMQWYYTQHKGCSLERFRKSVEKRVKQAYRVKRPRLER